MSDARAKALAASIIIDSLDRDFTNRDGTWTSREDAVAFITAALDERERVGRKELLIELSQRYAVGVTGIEILTWCHGELDKVCRRQGGGG